MVCSVVVYVCIVGSSVVGTGLKTSRYIVLLIHLVGVYVEVVCGISASVVYVSFREYCIISTVPLSANTLPHLSCLALEPLLATHL